MTFQREVFQKARLSLSTQLAIRHRALEQEIDWRKLPLLADLVVQICRPNAAPFVKSNHKLCMETGARHHLTNGWHSQAIAKNAPRSCA